MQTQNELDHASLEHSSAKGIIAPSPLGAGVLRTSKTQRSYRRARAFDDLGIAVNGE